MTQWVTVLAEPQVLFVFFFCFVSARHVGLVSMPSCVPGGCVCERSPTIFPQVPLSNNTANWLGENLCSWQLSASCKSVALAWMARSLYVNRPLGLLTYPGMRHVGVPRQSLPNFFAANDLLFARLERSCLSSAQSSPWCHSQKLKRASGRLESFAVKRPEQRSCRNYVRLFDKAVWLKPACTMCKLIAGDTFLGGKWTRWSMSIEM